MYLVDYHLHSKFSFDGHEEIDAICNEAIRKGVHEIAITDHMDIYTNRDYFFSMNCDRLYREVDRAKKYYENKLVIRSGVELGQPQVNPEAAKAFIENYELDFIIGSVHNMKDDIDVADFDFEENDCRHVYKEYLEWLLDYASHYEYDVLGHITYPLRYMAKVGIFLNMKEYEDPIRYLYKIIIEKGKGIELNTSGLYQEINETMPNQEVLKWYKECGGEIITIGSDAHYLQNVGQPIRTGMEILQNVGFRYIATYERRKISFRKIL